MALGERQLKIGYIKQRTVGSKEIVPQPLIKDYVLRAFLYFTKHP